MKRGIHPGTPAPGGRTPQAAGRSEALAVTLTVADLRALVADAAAEALAELEVAGEADGEVMTRADCARFLRCSLPTLDRLVRNEGLPFHPLGDCRRFLRSEVLEWLRAGSDSRTAPEERSQKEPRPSDAGHQAAGCRSGLRVIPSTCKGER